MAARVAALAKSCAATSSSSGFIRHFFRGGGGLWMLALDVALSLPNPVGRRLFTVMLL